MKETGGNGIAGGEKRDLSARTHGLANFPQQAVWGWRQLPVPVIAAIQGVAFGGGFQLALGADMRFLTPDARMSIMEIKWGSGARHGRHADPRKPRARRYFARSHLYRADLLGAGSDELRPRNADLRRSRAAAFEVAREIAGRVPMRSAPPSACSTTSPSIPALRCSPNPSSR